MPVILFFPGRNDRPGYDINAVGGRKGGRLLDALVSISCFHLSCMGGQFSGRPVFIYPGGMFEYRTHELIPRVCFGDDTGGS